ncbi:MAG: glucose-6-phosphate isomerase [Micavibrio aeruginosavorus]|uniref:Glucose-6-phosphate isomerase n=1 Tax=Micavibrio aeruginosavorus TaxID=349221 RepID=A0A7T5R1S2_9BACT|nr:MAG: glucose-6-phosphate isomerase [Micavibrio aeruginosavorus]
MDLLADFREFQALQRHREALKDFHLRQALGDRDRHRAMTIRIGEALFDFSKHLATPETLSLLIRLAHARDVAGWRDQMFSGAAINTSENRAVLHTALRAEPSADIRVGGVNVMPGIADNLRRMATFCDQVRRRKTSGATGRAITDVLNIGIGGSDLGPRFISEALRDVHDGPVLHFVSNVDGHAISRALAGLDPETTLVIVASKTFTTEETMLNAAVARRWLVAGLGERADLGLHLVALSSAPDKAAAFGVKPERIFGFADWVGGRYSVWSAIGLSVMLAIGPERFASLLAGARDMDHHFRTQSFEKNIPVMMGLLGVWYRNLWDMPAHVLLPYDDRLARLAKYVQQMDMESNGKAVGRDGRFVGCGTGPVIFGEPGTDSQHSFMQLVHQGQVIPADFIAVIAPDHDLADNHRSLLANCFAQSRALAIGQTLEEAGGDTGRIFSGNRPSTTILLPQLDPYHLGLLLAAYEHKVFVQGIIWGLNSFDQPGVELGKKLAKDIVAGMAQGTVAAQGDCSTAGLIAAALYSDGREV